MKFSSRQKITLIVIVLLAVSGIAFTTGLFSHRTTITSDADYTQCLIRNVTPIKDKNGQIIGTFPCATLTPTPSPTPTPIPTPTSAPAPTQTATCQLEGEHTGCSCGYTPADDPPVQEIVCSLANNCELVRLCEANNWPNWPVTAYTVGGQPLFQKPDHHQLSYVYSCSYLRRTLADGKEYCLAKPVIYLYPTTPQDTSVSITTPGDIFVSIPHYEKNGWQHVLAYPDGRLRYRGEEYHELYYETNVTDVKPPANGIILEKKTLKASLEKIVKQLGLNQSESEEFLAYWIPTLVAQNKDYLLFSLINTKEKERIDHVNISPLPDTRIEFLVYFKPLEKPVVVTPLVLPETPVRKGYTEVEWGGTLDLN